jgi:hypothetical protein
MLPGLFNKEKVSISVPDGEPVVGELCYVEPVLFTEMHPKSRTFPYEFWHLSVKCEPYLLTLQTINGEITMMHNVKTLLCVHPNRLTRIPEDGKIVS